MLKQENNKSLAKDKIEFVSCLMTNQKGNIVIFKRSGDSKLDAGKYDFCSGHMKEGETPTQAMYREIREEIGLMPEQIRLEKIGTIGTPHKKYEETLCHMYHTKINADIEKINEMIKTVENPELEEAILVENINALREKMQEENNNYRTIYTKQMKYFLEAMEQRISKKEETEKGR